MLRARARTSLVGRLRLAGMPDLRVANANLEPREEAVRIGKRLSARIVGQTHGGSAYLRHLAEKIGRQEDSVGPFTREAFERHQRVFAQREAQSQGYGAGVMGVFVRRDLPEGDQRRSGHGYSVALVRCKTRDQVKRVAAKLQWDGLPEPMGHPYPWYGGAMDLVAIFAANQADLGGTPDFPSLSNRLSIGDHRFVGMFDAQEILSPAHNTGTSA